MAEVRYTKEQRAAIEERRRTLLVSAAAGSGKTMTLTQRIIASLLDPERPADLSRMLVVTFTNAAAGELKDRIARALESELERSPDNAHLARQLLLLPSAAICTIDSWYSQLLRGYAPTVGLTPNFRIAEAAERDLLRQTVLDTLLESCYDGRAPEVCEGELFVRIAEALSSTREERRELPQTLLHLFELTEGYAEGPALLTRFAERLRAEAALPVHQTLWGGYIMTVTRSFLESTLATLRGALEALRAAEPAEAALYEPVFVSDLSLIEEALQAAEKGYAPLREALLSYSPARLPGLRGKSAAAERAKAARDAFKTERESFCKQFFAYTEEQWGPLMATMGELCGGICRLIQTFAERFEAEKRRRRICDFADLQRYVLRLLYKDGETTPLAAAISEAYDYIYIDEYQDVSPIQHRIFDAVARPDNLFMVGDIKQSIYSFRRAEPEIFASLRRAFPDLSAAGDSPRARLSLSDNFRSNAPVIDFINRVFDTLFGRAGESIGYVPADRLVCGNGVAEGVMPRLYLFENPPKAAPGEDSPPDEPEEGDTEEESAEAEWTAAQIDHLLRHERKPDGAAYLPSDIAILLRSVRGKADPYARALAKRGIRTETTEEKNFFLNPEVLLALCLLNTIDNPKKDIHLCGLLCSPLYDVTPDELVLIRQAADKNLPLYDALLVYCEQHPDFEKGHRFLAALSRFRRMAEGVPVDLLLRRLYSETGLLSLVAREGGQGRENLLALYHHARRFEGSSYQGLYSFIAYVNSLIEEGRSFSDTAQVAGDPFCVQIMTIHHAKGLEFPVCFVGGCGRAFNRSDTKAHLLFHGKLGLGLRMRDSTALARINNPIRNAIADAMITAGTEEELRLLYVAMTRAKERLYLTARPQRGAALQTLLEACALRHDHLSAYHILRADSHLKLLLYALGTDSPYLTVVPADQAAAEMAATVGMTATVGMDSGQGETAGAGASSAGAASAGAETGAGAKMAAVAGASSAGEKRGAISNSDIGAASAGAASADEPCGEGSGDPEAWRQTLSERFSFVYPHAHLGKLPRKLAVSSLYPAVLDAAEQEQTALPAEAPEPEGPVLPAFYTGQARDHSAKQGTATHLFLQFCDLAALREGGVAAELDRLCREGFLSDTDRALVRTGELERFARSSLLQSLLSARELRREFRFHVRLPAAALTADPATARALAGESVLVQGVIDCLVLTERGELWLLDYKTDRLRREERADKTIAARVLRERYRLQLSYYAAAVRRMYGRAADRVLLYSLHLGDSIELPAAELLEI